MILIYSVFPCKTEMFFPLHDQNLTFVSWKFDLASNDHREVSIVHKLDSLV